MADINDKDLPAMYQTGQYLRRIPGAVAGVVQDAGNGLDRAASGVARGIGNFGLALAGLPPLAEPFSAIKPPASAPAPAAAAPAKAPAPVAKAPASAPAPAAPAARTPKAPRAPRAAAPAAPAAAPTPEGPAWSVNDPKVQASLSTLGDHAQVLPGGIVAIGPHGGEGGNASLSIPSFDRPGVPSPDYTPKGVPPGMVQMIKGTDAYYSNPGVGQPKMYLDGSGKLTEMPQDQRNAIVEKMAGHELAAGATIESARIRSAGEVASAREHGRAAIEASKAPVVLPAPQNYMTDTFGVGHVTGGGALGIYDLRVPGGFAAVPASMQQQTKDVTAPPQPNSNHISALVADPSLAAWFDKMYGVGASKRILGK